MIHTANEFTAKHNRHILFQVAAGLKALPPPGPGRPDTSSQIASDTASAATHTHMDKVCLLTFNHHASSIDDLYISQICKFHSQAAFGLHLAFAFRSLPKRLVNTGLYNSACCSGMA